MLENKNLPRSRPRISGLRNFKSFVNLDDASHQPAGPLHENLQHRLKSIPPILNGRDLESTGTKIAHPETSDTGPTGRKPHIQTATDIADLTARAWEVPFNH